MLAVQTYSFYPTLVGSTAPLQSARLPDGVVAVRGLTPQVRGSGSSSTCNASD